MKRYVITFLPQAEKEFDELDSKVRRAIARRINGLAEDPRPRGAKKLAGAESTYRLRAGDYRVLYEVNDSKIVVVVVKVGHRQHVYRRRSRIGG